MNEYQCGMFRYGGGNELDIGDYNGSGLVGLSNQRVIDEMIDQSEGTDRPITVAYLDIPAAASAYAHWPEDPERSYHWPHGYDIADLGADVCIATYAYGARCYFIRTDEGAHPEIRELSDRLANYPLLDEGVHSQIESDQQDEAWGEVARDLIRWLGYKDPGLDFPWLPDMGSDVYGIDAWFTSALCQIQTWDLGEWHDETGGLYWSWNRNDASREAPMDTIRARICDLAIIGRRDGQNPWPAIWLALTGDHASETEVACLVMNDWLIDHDLADVMIGETATIARKLWADVVDAAYRAVSAESE